MAIHKSALKRMRQNEKRRVRNRHIKSTLKTHIKNYLKSIEDKDVESADVNLKATISCIDKAVSKGIIHKKNASRKKSRLTQKYNAIT